MIEQINLQNWVDIGFVALVTFVCAKSLFRDSDGADTKRDTWRGELKNLEQTLRGLINEAGAASSSLDRSLLQRKRELENLLKKFEEKEQTKAASAVRPGSPRSESMQQVPEEELPNQSWKQPAAAAKRAGQASRAASAAKPSRTDDFVLGSELDRLAAAADDTVTLSSRIMQQASKAAGRSLAAEQTLSEQIEMVNTAEAAAEAETFGRLSIMDPSTYKIARRLLKEGKEIHVVSRKLDLPVSEIRLLDRLMRRESQQAGETIELKEERARVFPRHRTEMQMRQEINFKGAPEFGISQVDREIERELALL